MARGVNMGMVMGGRAARACDSCGSERARWYCAADEAYLCERCDAAVHMANPVALRHDRARLAPNGAPLKIQRSTPKKQPQPQLQPQSLPPGPLPPTRKRPRTPRTHPALLHTNAPHLAFPATVPSLPPLPKVQLPPQPVHIKPEPPSSPSLDVQVPDHTHLLESLFDLHDDTIFLHEVPIFTEYSDTTEHKPSLLHHDDFPLQDGNPIHEDAKPVAAAPASILIHHSFHEEDLDDESAVQRQSEADEGDTLHSRAADESMDHFLVPGNCIDIEHFLDSASPNLSELESEIDGMMAERIEADQAVDDRSSEDGSYGGTAGYGGDHHQNNTTGAYTREVCYGGESPRSWLCKVKVESPPELEADIIDEGTQLDGFAHELVLLSQKLSTDYDTQIKDDHDRDHHVISKRPKLGLQLDIEAVLNAWSDKGSLWMDGQRPDESSLDCLGEWLVPDTNYFNSSIQPKTDQLGLVPVMQKESLKASGAAREARVMRYREKRRNRLFSKKIRYEVRKLNAEKRPRMKGRFVKRTPCMS